MALPALGDFLPDTPGTDELLDALIEWSAQSGLELYPHQEEAVLRLLAGENVVLSTPTGSGKSLVALAGAFAMLAQGRRAVYTAPIKALVSEKFFELTAAFGPSEVGMVTGDASVNVDAPVIACTAEILAQRALRAGSDTAADLVVMDEFHYYGDRDRGWAWQVPLLELPGSRFLLMSATLGDTTGLRRDLTARTGRDTALVASAERPVPLDVEYRETPLHVSIEELLKTGRAPVYIVHFTQREATARAQSLTSLNVLSADEKAAVKEAVGGFRFDTPIGKDLRRFVLAGIGVHHAGMLPKYRLLVEKLAQQGHLKLICGTDTLGVGVNVPIRTVLFTQLYKYDGRRTRVLSVRDFQQIAGRAGRRGFDTVGSVWVQAPQHAVENKRAEMRAAGDPRKLRKLVRKKPPDRGYAHYDDKTLTRLWEGTPETLESSFDVTHAMMLNVLDRPGDGCAAMKRLLVANHEPRTRQRRHIRKAVGVFRSLIDAEIVEVLPEPDESGRPVRVNIDLQDEFRLNQPLGLFAVEAVSVLDPEAHDYHLQVLSVAESVLEDPMAVLLAQRDAARDELMTRMKEEGVEYEERMARLAEVTWPKPEAEFIEPAFDTFARHHPWVGHLRPSPKSVVRDMVEHADTFNQYVSRYGLKRSEGLVLRYLTDCYKALVQTVPAAAVDDRLAEVIEWLGELVRDVDSSLLDEWERLRAV
jgi:superfamily II RNA helicase